MSIIRHCRECNTAFSVKSKCDPKKFCGLSCSTINKNKTAKEKKILEYLKNPTLCKKCNSIIDYDHSSNQFCSHSCCATYNNLLRGPRSQKSKDKTSATLKGKPTTKKQIVSVSKNKTKIICVRVKHSPVVLYCPICRNLFVVPYTKRKQKTCSVKCKNISIGRQMKNYIAITPLHKLNRSPIKRSYMEKSFEDWLITKGMKHSLHGYLYEIRFRNKISKKNWRADFVFPKQRIIVELDGTQHNAADREKLDIIRDEFLVSRGWQVIRISHAEYKAKTKEQMLIDLLF
jgi:very-short-patch-repair endonuclease